MSRVVVRAEQRITSPYGVRNGVMHNGVDIGWTKPESENNIYANCKGNVIQTVKGKGNTYGTSDHGYGNYVLVRHDNGFTSLYAHLDKVYVSNGQTVDENTIVGVMGNTGYSAGRHLHFEVKNNQGIKIDPTPYLSKAISDTSSQPVPSQNSTVKTIQQTLNARYNTNLVVDGIFGPATKKGLVKGLQTELNRQFNKGLVVDGIFGPATKNACVIVRLGHSGNITWLIQAMLNIKGYGTNGLDGIFGSGTQNAVRQYQKDCRITSDGIVGPQTFEKLFV